MVGLDDCCSQTVVVLEGHGHPLAGLLIEVGRHRQFIIVFLKRYHDLSRTTELVHLTGICQQTNLDGLSTNDVIHNPRREHGVADAHLGITADGGRIECHRTFMSLCRKRRVVEFEYFRIPIDEA